MRFAGAALSRVAEIDKTSQLLTDVERGEAWLYAWALVKRHENRLLVPMRNGDYDEGARAD